nr:LamG-like jellyroll fold domain-containing protein [uncultured Desulfobacter sp.]
MNGHFSKNLLVLFLGLLLTVFFFKGVSFAGINDGLVVYYPFNGNANDESGNGNHGTVCGASLTLDRFSIPNNAFSFDGINDYIEIIDNDRLRLSNTDFTISVWLYETERNSSYNDALLVKRGYGQENGWFVGLHGMSASVAGTVHYQVSSGVDPNVHSISQVSLNDWHHVVATYDIATQKVKLYIDSELDRTQANIPSPNANTDTNLTIGSNSSIGAYFFHGSIDDIRIYNRSLSEEEILELYNEPAGPIADAGDDQIICSELCSGVLLDGTQSKDSNNEIMEYIWEIKHRDNSSNVSTATGEIATLLNLEPGIYDVKLTVIDNNGLVDSDEMILTFQETCDHCLFIKGDLDNDGNVDGDDLIIFSEHFGSSELSPNIAGSFIFYEYR